jgi:aminoglycoside phosphotransferase (APT) family kinase protein
VEFGTVRPGEELDWDALAAYLRPVLGVDGPMEVQQFLNGSANLTYRVSFGDEHFVVRRPPFGQIAPGAHDMKREHRVLSKLHQAYDRAPQSYALCEDHDVIGSDFDVMEYRAGEVVWDTLPPSISAVPDVGRKLGLAVVDALAELHMVDPAACGLEQLGRPDGFVRRQVDGWRTRWELVATPDNDELMTRVGSALSDSLPASGPPTLLHNDFKVDNCQIAPGHPERVITVFDWDMATLGDPLVDLGTLLNYWVDPDPSGSGAASLVAGIGSFGLPSKAEITERYGEVTGADVSAVGWYEAFAAWKTAVVLQQLHQRYVRGESTDPRMADRGRHISALADRAEHLLNKLEED